MRNQMFIVLCGTMLLLGITGAAAAQETASQQLQAIHGPQSIDQKLDQLTKDLQLTPEQQKQVKTLLEEHHNKIQALFDKNPTATRQALGPQIHAISDETHREIHTLLNDNQKELEKKLLQRGRKDEEDKQSTPPAAAFAEPPLPAA